MAEYQNIFTQVQVRGPAELGLDPDGILQAERGGTPRFSNLLGWLGNAQLGPIHLGMFGVISAYLFAVWFLLVGFNMLGQVDYNFYEFIKQLFWLAMEPPAEEYGLSMPPLNLSLIHI